MVFCHFKIEKIERSETTTLAHFSSLQTLGTLSFSLIRRQGYLQHYICQIFIFNN